MNSLSPQRSILDRLNGVRRRMRTQLVLEGIGLLLLLMFVLAAVSFFIDWRFDLSRPTRIVLGAISIVASSYVFVRRIAMPLLAKWEPMDIAGAIDLSGFASVDQAISPKVATVLQLSESGSRGAASDLIDEAARRSHQALEQIDFENRLNTTHRNRSLIAMGAGIFLPLLCVALIPMALTSVWFGRWFAGSEIAWPRNTKIEIVGVVDNRLVIPRGDPLEAEFLVTHKHGRVPDRIRIEFRDAIKKPQRLTIVHDAQQKFFYEIPGVSTQAELTVWAGDGQLGPVAIVPVDRPRLVSVKLAHQHPWDETIQVHDFESGDGSVSLLPKSKVQLTLQSNVPLESIEAEWNLARPASFARIDDSTFQLNWEQQDETQIKLELVGAEAGLRSDQRALTIGLKQDLPPSVTLSPKGLRRRVTPTASLPLNAVAHDDYGLANLNLTAVLETPVITDVSSGAASESSTSNSQQELVLFGPANPATERLVDMEHLFALATLKLSVGDSIKLRATAVDGCYLGGQAAESPWLTFRIVNPQELFQEILARQQQMRTRLRKATDRATDMRDKLATAQFPQAAEDLLREHKLNQREVSTIQRTLSESVREMELNQLGGEEAINLIRNNVVKPLERLVDAQMNQQRNALEKLGREGKADPTGAMQRQEKIVADMQRVLKNMNQWDSFVDVINQLDAVIEMQSKLKKATDQLKEQDIESIFED